MTVIPIPLESIEPLSSRDLPIGPNRREIFKSLLTMDRDSWFGSNFEVKGVRVVGKGRWKEQEVGKF